MITKGRSILTIISSMENGDKFTELSLLKESLDQERNRFESILKNAPDIIMQINLQGEILFLNRGFPGLDRESMLGVSIFKFLKPDAQRMTEILLRQVDRFPDEFDYCFIDFEEKKYYHVRYVPFYYGTSKYVLISSTNITDRVHQIKAAEKTRVQLEEQKARMVHKTRLASLGELSTSLAHEITNPLTIFSGHVEQLKKKIESKVFSYEDYMANIRELEKSLIRMTKVSKSLAHFSRDVSRDAFVFISIKDIVEETLELIDYRIKKHDVSLIVGDIPDIQVECRDVQIAQVLMNLITNSVQAIADHTERWIRLEFFDLGHIVQFCVTDSGKGIPPEKRDLIFSPFFTSKPSGTGTGLGLSISQKIVAAHHGTLKIKADHPNTKFVFELPRIQPDLPSRTADFLNSKYYQSETPIWR